MPPPRISPTTAHPISSDQGWHRFIRALSRTAPRSLHQTGLASAGLLRLRTKGR